MPRRCNSPLRFLGDTKGAILTLRMVPFANLPPLAAKGRCSMDWYPLWNSLRIAAISTVIIFFAGIFAAYYIAKLPGEEKAEFFNSIPFTPKSKKNMTALMVARNDGEHYGELVLYQFPKSKTIYGPEQVEAQIDQNTEISKEFSLWNSSGTTYRRGNMFIIPINSSILYVEPVYLEATNSSIPEVKRIIVAYDDKIAYEETLAECLVSLFGDEAASGIDSSGGSVNEQQSANEETGQGTSTTSELSQTELIQKAASAYDNAQSALQQGDWAAYGEYMDELEDALSQLAA